MMSTALIIINKWPYIPSLNRHFSLPQSWAWSPPVKLGESLVISLLSINHLTFLVCSCCLHSNLTYQLNYKVMFTKIFVKWGRLIRQVWKRSNLFILFFFFLHILRLQSLNEIFYPMIFLDRITKNSTL